VIQKFSDPPRKSCPRCKGKLRKKISAPAIQFKGTGWYVTDYSGKKGGGEAEKKEKPADPAPATKEPRPAEAPAKEKAKDPGKKGKE
jgi:hypothetical protein